MSSMGWITEEDCNIVRGARAHTTQVEVVKARWRGRVHATNGLDASLREEFRRSSTGSGESEERKGEESENWIGGFHLGLIFGGINGLTVIGCVHS